MSTHKLKSVAQRGSMLVAAAALVAATIAPAAVFADALNPLTERSLLLSSSAPGFQDTDGSGNSTASPNPSATGGLSTDPGYIPGTYAPAGSGANGMKTGQSFSFRVSTNSSSSNAVKAFTLQYCTEAAGLCKAPGNNTGDARAFDREANGTQGDARTPDRLSNAASKADSKSDLDVNYTSPVAGTDFQIFVDGVDQSTGWTMTTSNVEDFAHSGALTGKKNFITLANGTGINPAANAKIEIKFFATETNYITNPGSGAFFVKMNTYNSELPADHLPATDENIIDGGVTVANVMTDSIHITTKVLETMAFSVGTQNPDTVVKGSANDHGTCESILTPNGNRLQLGNPDAEYSLETGKAYDVKSWWRLSSNSSGGATVYYSGETLANTVGDVIAPIGGTRATSQPGTEQFGLAFMDHDATSTSFEEQRAANATRYRNPNLYVLNEGEQYNYGNGTLDNGSGGAGTAQFAFLRSSLTNPVAIADNLGAESSVLTCETAQMRYVANIGADTPAGVYTTKINYLAAPQY